MPLKIVIILSGFVLFGVLYIFSQKKYRYYLRLRLVKAVHGRYCSKYVILYKKYYNRHVYTLSIKDYVQNHYYMFFKKPLKNILETTVDIPINFIKLPYGYPEKQFLKQNQEPDTVNSIPFEAGVELRVFGFDEKIFLNDMRTQFYFLGKEFFMGEYVFPCSPDENISSIKEILQNEILGEVRLHSDEFIINGANNTALHYMDNGFNITVKYFSCANREICRILRESLNIFEAVTYDKDDVVKLQQLLRNGSAAGYMPPVKKQKSSYCTKASPDYAPLHF